jgi:hypothetical protein
MFTCGFWIKPPALNAFAIACSAAGIVRPADFYRADQWIANRAIFGDAGFHRKVRVLEYDDPDVVAPANLIFGLIDLRIGAKTPREGNDQ